MNVFGSIARIVLAALALCASLATTANAHETMPDPRSEAQLRAFEEEALGPEHAREHALQRKLARELPSRPDVGALPSSASSETVFGERLGEGGGLSTAALDCDSSSTEPACAGSWAAPFSIPVMAINAVMLPTGKVLWWAYPTNPSAEFGDPDAENTAEAWLWDPGTGSLKHVDPPLWHDPQDPPGVLKPANIWCSGQSLLQDGRVVVAGGNLEYEGDGDDYKGLDAVFTFNPWNERWTRQPDMEHGRWYPSQLLLPDGRTLILSGFDETGGGYASTNKQVELLTPSAGLDGQGSIAVVGERGDDETPPDGGLYPHTFVMPDGRVMVAGPDPNDSWYLNDPDDLTDWDNFAWDELPGFTPGVSRQRLYGTGVLMPPPPGSTTPSDRVALIGGDDRIEDDNGPAVATMRIHDEDDPESLGGTLGAPMQLGRGHHNTVLLADGSMVTVGGGVGYGDTYELWESTPSRKRVELYDPVENEWRLGAAQGEYRTYHSTAILLPDGRVISAGDDYNGGIDQDTAEVYSPPYLFAGARPAVTGAPKTVAYGTTFGVSYQGPQVTRAALVAPGATTHAVDMNQRYVPLEVDPGAPGTATIHAPPGNASNPAGRDVAPPGWYMLFLLSADGVPSVASWVRVDASPPQPGTITVRKVVTSGGPGAFDFSGAPFPDFALGGGQQRSKTVVASEYSLVEAPEPGFALTGVSCDDGNSVGSVAQRRATVRVEAGETVRCTFTSASVLGPPQPPAKPDRTGPSVSFNLRRGLVSRRGLLRGGASDRSGVRRIDVAFGRRVGDRCRWWSKRKRRLGVARLCRRPAYIRAKLVRAGGSVRWTVALGGRPPAGRYRVVIKATDRKGNVRRVTRAPVVVRSS